MRKLKCVLCLLLLPCLLGGCYDAKEIDAASYLIAVAIDKGDVQPYRFTFEFTKAQEGESGSSSQGKEDSQILTVEAPTFFTAAMRLDEMKSKAVNYAHLKTVVLSEAVCTEGAAPLLDGFVRGEEFENNPYVAVARGSAAAFLENSKPMEQMFISKYYNYIFNPKYHTMRKESLLNNLYFDMVSHYRGAAVPLVGVNQAESGDSFAGGQFAPMDDLQDATAAGDLLRNAESKGDFAGLALFREDRLVEMLNYGESVAYAMVTHDFRRGYITLQHPEEDGYLVFSAQQERKPKITVETNPPRVKAELFLHGSLALGQMEAGAAERYFARRAEEKIKEVITKTQACGCDVFGFGDLAKGKFPTVPQWEAYDWQNKYPTAGVEVTVHFALDETSNIGAE